MRPTETPPAPPSDPGEREVGVESHLVLFAVFVALPILLTLGVGLFLILRGS